MKIGVIGCGLRAKDIAKALLDYDLGVEIAAIVDPQRQVVEERLTTAGIQTKDITWYDNEDELFHNEKLDGVVVATNCSSHARIACRVMKENIPLYLEKPVATNMEDLLMLKKAYESAQSEVVVSFPLRITPLVQMAKEIINSGKIGTIEHVQAINDVPYGRVYYKSWYRDENETGGLFLQKATHDFDYINYLLGIKPIEICAMKSKQIYKGNHPVGLHCTTCDERETCPESTYVMEKFTMEVPHGDFCSFAVDTGNEDSGSAIIRYETGMHVNYTQNFLVRKAAGRRGAILTGYKGTIEFDWYKDELKVFMHEIDRVETYKFDTAKINHGGGDGVLMHNFIKIMQGKEKSVSRLEDGLLSALMCLKAKKAAETSIYQKIDWN